MSTLKVKTLEVTNEKAYELLGDAAGLYGDNVGDCDGNANFPSDLVENDDVFIAGFGSYHVVCYYQNDFESISENLKIRKDATPELFAEQRGSDTVEYEDVRDALNAAENVRWSGYDNGSTIIIEYLDIPETRNFTLRTRLTDAERSQLQAAADQIGQSMSEYVRRKIF